MVNCIDNDGNPVRLGAGQPTTQQGPTPGPWRLPQVMESPEYEQWVRQYDWHALLLRAVLKGWTIYEWEGAIGHEKGEFLLQLHRSIVQYWLKPDANGLPAPPADAETYERIRKAVDGD